MPYHAWTYTLDGSLRTAPRFQRDNGFEPTAPDHLTMARAARLCAVSPPNGGDNCDLPGAWVGGTMDLGEGTETMSLDGKSGGPLLRDAGRGRVGYLALCPDLLLSLHPDYVMAHRLSPVTPGTTPRGPRSSGTAPIGRTGRHANPYSAAWHRRSAGPARSPPTRTPHTAGWP